MGLWQICVRFCQCLGGLVPAATVRMVRVCSRSIMNRIILRKSEKARLYKEHEYEKDKKLYPAKVFMRGIDNVIEKSDNEAAMNAARSELWQSVKSAEKEVCPSPEQEDKIAQIIKYHVQDVSKNLSEEQKKRLGKSLKIWDVKKNRRLAVHIMS